jgi:hypothetical protein
MRLNRILWGTFLVPWISQITHAYPSAFVHSRAHFLGTRSMSKLALNRVRSCIYAKVGGDAGPLQGSEHKVHLLELASFCVPVGTLSRCTSHTARTGQTTYSHNETMPCMKRTHGTSFQGHPKSLAMNVFCLACCD